MFRQTYNSMNECLTPDSQLVQATLQKMEAKRGGRHYGAPRRRGVMIAVAAAVLVCASLTALAAAPGLAQFWESLTAKYGEHVQLVEPVEPPATSTAPDLEETQPQPEAQGASGLQVMAAAVDQDNAEIYFTLTDPEGRIGENALAIGELQVGPLTVPVSARPVFCDPESGTAVFCQSLYSPDGIDGSEATLQITGVYSSDAHPSGDSATFTLALNDLPLTQDPQTLSYTMPSQMDAIAQSWPARYNTISQEGAVTLLAPGEDQPIPGVEGVSISAAGYVDGRLHVQFHLKAPGCSALLQGGMVCSDPQFEPGSSYDDATFDTLFNLSHGQVVDFYEPFLDKGDNVADSKKGYEYVEIISSLPPDALQHWAWDFHLMQSTPILESTWQQSFPLNVGALSMRQNAAPFTVDVETLHLPENPAEEDFVSTWSPSTFDGLRVTPFGVTVSRPAVAEDEAPENDGILKRLAPDVSKLEITVETAEGTQACILDKEGYTVLPDEQGRMTARYLLEKTVEPEEIISLKVNGVDVPLTDVMP